MRAQMRASMPMVTTEARKQRDPVGVDFIRTLRTRGTRAQRRLGKDEAQITEGLTC